MVISAAPLALDLQVGTRIADTYEVTGILGRGGMGAVFVADHLRLPGKRVAIKVLLRDVTSDPDAYARFRREAEIASRIGHPNIVEVLDFNTLPNGQPYLVLELLEGEDLAARLRNGPMPFDEAMAIVRQIGSALAAAHREQIIHRDLKPANIFLCPTDSGGQISETVKVLDFGISKIKGSSTVVTQSAVMMGTPQYMAPEQASGKREVDGRTDEFALAAIVYEMLTGIAPFAGENITEVIYKVMLEFPPSLGEVLPGLPPNVYDAVDRGLSKDPNERFSDIAGFVAALTGRPLASLDRTRKGTGPQAVDTPKPRSSEAFAQTMASQSPAKPAMRAPLPAASARAPSTPPPAVRTDDPTVPRQEAIPTASDRPRQSIYPLLLTAVGFVLVVGAVIGARELRKPKSQHGAEIEPGRPSEEARKGTAPMREPVPPPIPPETKPTTVESKPIELPSGEKPPESAKIDSPAPGHEPHPKSAHLHPESLAAGALEPASPELMAAEAALKSGKPAEGLALAQQILRKQKSEQALFVVGTAQCRLGNLEGYNATERQMSKGSVARLEKLRSTCGF